MRIADGIKLDYEDVLIVPKRSTITSRKEVDIQRTFKTKHSGQEISGVPVIGANMAGISTFSMAKELTNNHMFMAWQKHNSVEETINNYEKSQIGNRLTQKTFYTMGITHEDFSKIKELKDKIDPCRFPKLICIDVANGHMELFAYCVSKLREMFPDKVIMAGNAATPEMVEQLILSGADIAKGPIGNGAVCTTRLVSAIGYPTLSAAIECSDACHGIGGLFCADGGCSNPCDIIKGIAAGADFVMIGSMLAGHDECFGEWEVDEDGNKSFIFFGMSSKKAQEKFNGGINDYRGSEGRIVKIPGKGPVINTIQQICGGLRSACAYVGARKLKDLSKCTTFIQVNRTHNQSLREYTIGT